VSACPLCAAGPPALWRDDFCRVILAEEPDYPGFCRVILNRHVKEMTDLAESERQRLMAVVFATEAAVRETLQPEKVNLASLGNVVPHLHWHVIPRYPDDRHYPDPVWAAPRRPATEPRTLPDLAPRLSRSLAERLGPCPE
jgi:diadenosine tetraphosphate (Ap4A) HIT family hydrolase